tara:strand:+ start:270 stop:482 length:213 start_codon:yes stop_codon:yes gene_type:complete
LLEPLRVNAARWIGIDPDRIRLIRKGRSSGGYTRYLAHVQGPVQTGDGHALAKFLNQNSPPEIMFSVEID